MPKIERTLSYPGLTGQSADAYAFGAKILGPAIADYCSRLSSHLLSFERDQGAKVLFVTRAGVRIRRAMETFSTAAGLDLPFHADYLLASRLMIAKGIWLRNRTGAIQLLESVFSYASIRDFIAAMYRYDGVPASIDLNQPHLGQRAANLEAFFAQRTSESKALEDYFAAQSSLFDIYLSDLLKDRDLAVLVDSGWQGTSQTLLQDAYPEITWWGAYFGRFGTDNPDRRFWPRMVGLVTEKESFDPAIPESCVVLHRHLIEDLFQPTGPSVERLVETSKGRISSPESAIVQDDIEASPLFSGVLEYLSVLPDGRGPAALRVAAQAAWREIARVVTMPAADDARLFMNVKRPADFGRSLEVNLLLEPKPRFLGDTAERRVTDALWPSGQCALEYTSDVALSMQRKLAGMGRSDVIGQPQVKVQYDNGKSRRAKVAVITRTLDRKLFLKRALESVAQQTFQDFVHVIVNDGGDDNVVRETIESSSADIAKVVLVDTCVNRGMEAASNIGIGQCDTEYIVIHDDDDSWDPKFLEKAVSFLDSSDGQQYGGVITLSNYVSESVGAEGIRVLNRRPYCDWIETVHVFEMAVGNFFPPISFVFRRDIYDAIGGFDERYPVLGDWDFNIRFLLDSNIAVIREYLANYHHRDNGDTGVFGNSVIAGKNLHVEFSAVVRNNLVRRLSSEGRTGEAALVGGALILGENRDLGRRSLQRLNEALSNSHLKSDGSDKLSSVRSSDANWIALQRLFLACFVGDTHVLTDVGLTAKPSAIRQQGSRMLAKLMRSRKRTLGRTPGLKNKPAITAEHIDRLLALRSGVYSAVPAPPDFDEARYLRDNPDVAAAIQNGILDSAFEHYFYHGREEGRVRPRR